MLRRLKKPVLTVMRWQLIAGVAMALTAAVLLGKHGAISAAVGVLIAMCAGFASAVVASLSDGRSAGGVLLGAMRAEGVKLGLSVILLWLVLTNYQEAMVGVLIGSFIVTILIFSMAFFVREY
jgi:F0F1-type ATP synthase assembly protein I